MNFPVPIILIFLICIISPSYGYDPLDPNGNITIKWDVLQDNDGTHDVRVSIVNYQLFRHIDPPGWKLKWTWPGDEVIWNMVGAETVDQGNCSRFKGKTIPHCCEKEPVIIDLLPGSPFNKQVANCCKGGVLTSILQDSDKNLAAFQMTSGSGGSDPPNNASLTQMPGNFTLSLPGYTCGSPFEVPPSKFTEDQGRRTTQALSTYNVTCSFSQFRASPTPRCCVSLSAFYDETIVPCAQCSCGCEGQVGKKCLKEGDLPPVLKLQPNEVPQALVQCSSHMCPIRIHWHVKESYKEYWRVKMTITNFNVVQNYSEWSLVVLHPNLKSITQLFSFNYKPLNQFHTNDSGMFYGIKFYNDMLIQAGENGNVQSEMLLHKDADMFTFKDGWAFPRKIEFNGEDCVMPQPVDFPRLPESAAYLGAQASSACILILSLMIVAFL